MCQTGGEKSALTADQAFGTEMRANYATDFGEAQGIFNNVNSSLEGIVAAGPNQQGESGTELAAQNSQAIENAAAANKNINASIREKAGMSGATPGVESGATEGAIANSEAKIENNLSNEEAGITEHNYDVGRSNFENAVGGEEKLSASTMDPTNQAAGEVTSANQTTGKQATENAASSNSWEGLVGGIANAATGALIKKFA
jgi:hypothetical protein